VTEPNRDELLDRLIDLYGGNPRLRRHFEQAPIGELQMLVASAEMAHAAEEKAGGRLEAIWDNDCEQLAPRA
jgi:hypothetical protein